MGPEAVETEQPFECPGCHQQLTFVVVVSKCWQKGYLKGAMVVDYGEVEEIEETDSIECPECQADLTGRVTEE